MLISKPSTMRILNVADFNWMSGSERDTINLSLFDICRKFTLAATRANHLVVEFSDRAVAKHAAPLGLRGLGGGWADRRFLQAVDELRPDLIFLHFADRISNAALTAARRLSPGVLIADINIDPIDSEKNRRRLGMRRGVADALMVTTAEPHLGDYVGPGSFACFMPNPVDRAIESGCGFDAEITDFDLLFPVSDSAPREMGGLFLTPEQTIQSIRRLAPTTRIKAPGVGGEPKVRGQAYFRALQSSRLGLALSRRASIPLYTSDRTAHMFGWGLGVFLDRRSGFERFYGSDEAAFYDDLPDLAGHLARLTADDPAARALARRGWAKTWALFDSGRVFNYVLAQLFTSGGAKGFEWPCDRWR